MDFRHQEPTIATKLPTWPLLAIGGLLLAGCFDKEVAPSEPPVLAGPPLAEPGLFFDGAENGTGQWEFTSNITLIDFSGSAPTTELPQPHSAGSWMASTDQAHNGSSSWFSQYPDDYRTRMQATIDVPAGGATLQFWYKGGAENNTFDGLHVFVGGTQVAYFAGALVDWTLAEYPLPTGATILEFRFDADPFCSSASPPRPPGDPSQMACIEGWDAGGYYLDDITVSGKLPNPSKSTPARRVA